MSEDKLRETFEADKKKFFDDRLNIPTLKYFWQVSPLSGGKLRNIPKFLRSIEVFRHFSDYELKVFSGFMHERIFSNDEIVIKEGDTGFGFYLIFTGNIEVYTQRNRVQDGVAESYNQFITRLSKYEYLGELALLEQQNRRNATAVSKGISNLLAIYRPDLEEMIDRHPVIGAKFLQAISLIVAMRFNKVTEELKNLKESHKLLEQKLEKKIDSSEN